MLAILSVLKVLLMASAVLSPVLIKETSEVVGAGVAYVELELNHATGEEKKKGAIKVINEGLDVLFLKFPASESQKKFIEDVFVPNAIEVIVYLLNKLGFFQKKTLTEVSPFIGPPAPKEG